MRTEYKHYGNQILNDRTRKWRAIGNWRHVRSVATPHLILQNRLSFKHSGMIYNKWTNSVKYIYSTLE